VTTKHSFLTCTDLICFIFFPNVNIENEHSVCLKLPKFLVWSFINLCILVCLISGWFLLVDTLNCFHQADNEADRMDWVHKITGVITSLFNFQFLQQVIYSTFLKHKFLPICPYMMSRQHFSVCNCCSLIIVNCD
jgi:hypothetical protein